MKGKITYLAVVEKEIEIPDEIVKIVQKPWFDWTEEEDDKMRTFSDNAWDSIENSYDRIGIYYEEDGKDWVLEEY
jgi:hypothetical protein